MAWGQEKGADVKISALRACQYEIFDFVPCSLPLKILILLTFSCFLIRRRGNGTLFFRFFPVYFRLISGFSQIFFRSIAGFQGCAADFSAIMPRMTSSMRRATRQKSSAV